MVERLISTGDDLTIPDWVVVPAGNVTGLDGALQDRDVSLAGVIYVESFPRLGGETTDDARLGRAIAACGTLGARVLALPAKTYTLAAQVNVNVANLTIRGVGRQATILQVTGDVIALNVTASYVTIQDLRVYCSTTGRTVFPVKFTGASHSVIERCYFSGDAGAWRAGVHFSGGSMARVEGSTFSHACIRVETWDVRITECFVWAMSCEFGIGIYSNVGNTRIEGVDLVPPEVATAGGLAGIYVEGASLNTRMHNIYLDGNPSLNVRPGIILKNGVGGTIISGVIANRMDSDCIILDSVYNVLIDGYSGAGNNAQGNGAREIVVRQTGAQPTEHIRIVGAQCLQTAAVTGTAGPAIEVESSVAADNVSIVDFDVKQPSGGNGYTLPEVLVPTSGGYPTQSMSGRGQLGRYSAVGSVAVASGAAGVTIIIATPYPMAYRPRPAQIALAAEGATLPPYRISYTSDNQCFATFASPISGAATIHWRATLAR